MSTKTQVQTVQQPAVKSMSCWLEQQKFCLCKKPPDWWQGPTVLSPVSTERSKQCSSVKNNRRATEWHKARMHTHDNIWAPQEGFIQRLLSMEKSPLSSPCNCLPGFCRDCLGLPTPAGNRCVCRWLGCNRRQWRGTKEAAVGIATTWQPQPGASSLR